MNREGDILKKAIDRSDFTIDQVIAMTGIPKGTLYSLFGKEEIKFKYKEKIKNLNLKIDWESKNSNISENSEINQSSERFPGENALKQVISVLNTMIDRLDSDNKKLEKDKEELRKDKEEMRKDHRIFQAIIEKGVNEGNIKFTKKMEF
jgi:phage repressor protein C with HTH and peptisase S24 domain